MASQQTGNQTVKPSFAKVAAMSLPPKPQALPIITQKPAALHTIVSADKPGRIRPETVPDDPVTLPHTQTRPSAHVINTKGMIEGIERLTVADLHSSKGSSPIPSGQDSARVGTDSNEDDASHLSTSSTKGPSFDTKSLASVTTFAMDEKESLRPDDSASVQAGDEEEHQSPSGGGINASQISSDVGAAPTRFQLRDGYTFTSRRPPVGPMLNPPRFGDLPLPSSVEASQAPNETTQPDAAAAGLPPPLVQMPSIAPDEKLLDAMGTPKDRLLLLQLEEKIVAFIRQIQVDYLDLPPQNSFGRLLAHKLADYYNVAHYINADNSSVRLFRGSNSALPTPLSMIAATQNMAASTGQQTGATAVKIMRRGGLGQSKSSADASTDASSSVPSKTTSDAEGDATSDEGLMSPMEATPSKDKSKWTREEKEAHYKAARERIFGDFQGSMASENNSTGEVSASMSRSSSSSGKKRTHRQRVPKDDSFEARSQFVPGYGGMTYSNPQSQYHPTFGNAPYPSPYASNPTLMPTTGYGTTPTASFPTYDPQPAFNGPQTFPMSFSQQFGSPDGWSNPQSPPPAGNFYNYATSNQSSPMYPQHPMPSPPTNPYFQPAQPNFQQVNPNWTQNPYQGSYQQPTMTQSPPAVHWPNFPSQASANTPPYQYGQLPSQSYGGTFPPSNQHPLPGSFNRSIFNPQTRSFVPANSSGRFNAKSSKSAQSKSAVGKQSNGVAEHARLVEGMSVTPARTVLSPPPITNGSASKPHVESIQKKWGTPAHLPKKPPPSQVPSAFDIETTSPLPSQQSYVSPTPNVVSSSPLIVSGGNAGYAPPVTGGVVTGS